MKNILLLLIALIVAIGATAQDELPKPGDIPKEYRKEYRKTKSDVLDNIKEAEKDGFDIILDPIEQVPTEILEARAMDFKNWGADILANLEVRSRIRSECKHQVVVKPGDTAGKYDHADLLKGQLPGADYSGKGLQDGNGHGTHVAGIIAGEAGGLAWELVDMGLLTFKPIKVLGDNGSGSFSWVANAIAGERAEDETLLSQGTGVVYNFSLGGGTSLIGTVEAELKKSTDAGVLFVCAAGNSGGPVNYPGKSSYTAATAALQQSLQVASFSSRGPEVTTAMPGVAILSTWKNGGYATLSGTSMASPFATAAAAIAVSKWGLMSQQQLTAYLAKVAQDLGDPGKDDLYGWGISYIRAILDTAPGGTPPPDPDPDPEPEPTPFPKRTITFEIPSSFVMLWDVYTPSQGDKKKAPEDLAFARQLGAYQFGVTGGGIDFLTVDEPAAAGLKRLTVTGLTVEVETTVDAAETAKLLRDLTANYFTSRAVYMGPPVDFYTATYWTAYFYDLILTRQYKGPPSLKVVAITGTDEAGNAVRLEGDELKDIQ